MPASASRAPTRARVSFRASPESATLYFAWRNPAPCHPFSARTRHEELTMSDVWTPEKFGETLTVIFRRSVEDAEFRTRCLAMPDAAIEEAGQAPIPPEYLGKVQFTETAEAGKILLPAFGSSQASSDKLTDAE